MLRLKRGCLYQVTWNEAAFESIVTASAHMHICRHNMFGRRSCLSSQIFIVRLRSLPVFAIIISKLYIDNLNFLSYSLN